MSGALTSGLKNDDVASATITAGTGSSIASAKIGTRQSDERGRAEAQRVEAVDEAHGDDASEHRADAERSEEQPGDARAVVLLVGEHSQPCTDHLPEPVRDHRRDAEHAEQPVVEEEADPGEHAARLLRLRQRRARRDEQREQDERDEERRRVDVQHDGRAERGDEHAGRRRAEQRRGALGALEDGVRLGDRPLVVADELGQDEPLRRVVRREEHPDQRHEGEEHGEAQPAEGVEDRDRREQRRPDEVGDDHHAPGAPRAR